MKTNQDIILQYQVHKNSLLFWVLWILLISWILRSHEEATVVRSTLFSVANSEANSRILKKVKAQWAKAK